MNIFDQLVDEALVNRQDLAPLRAVVEKELLHHDILRVLSAAGLLDQLTFVGGTCLRACYGSVRLSEDLDFTGGGDFQRESLAAVSRTLVEGLLAKYGLAVTVTAPVREVGNVDTWKLRVQTNAGRKDLPPQRINIDICKIRSYDVQPMMVLNPYGVEMGTSGLFIQAQSREEIFVDKLIAFALRPNRIKNRDLWDIAWLQQQSVQPRIGLLARKVNDHNCEPQKFVGLFDERCALLAGDSRVALDFRQEMRRFLPAAIVVQSVDHAAFWIVLSNLMRDLAAQVRRAVEDSMQPPAP